MQKEKDRCGIIIDPGCSNNCVFCLYPSKKSVKEIKKHEIEVAQDLIMYRKKEYRKIDISGGDPIEYDKIVPLVRYLKKIGFKDGLLNTHGVGLDYIEFTKELINAGITQFRIPIYGISPQMHDSVTQTKGSYERTIKGIENIKKICPSIKLNLHTLVLLQNKENILDILKLAISLKMDNFGISVVCLKDKGKSYYVPYKDLWKYLEQTVDYVLKNKHLNVVFYDIPHCVFGFFNKQVVMSVPPDLGKYNQPGKKFKTKIKDLPKYRLKKKYGICKSCLVSHKCLGFHVNDIKRYGIGNLKPIK